MRGEPAFDGVALAILLFGAVLGRDELGHQGDDLGMAGRHDGGRQQAMIALGVAVGALAGQTIRAGELLRAEILRSIPGDVVSSARRAEGLPQGEGPGQPASRCVFFRDRAAGGGAGFGLVCNCDRESGCPKEFCRFPNRVWPLEQALAAFPARAERQETTRSAHEKHRESPKDRRSARYSILPPQHTPLRLSGKVRRIRPSGRTKGRAKPASQPSIRLLPIRKS